MPLPKTESSPGWLQQNWWQGSCHVGVCSIFLVVRKLQIVLWAIVITYHEIWSVQHDVNQQFIRGLEPRALEMEPLALSDWRAAQPTGILTLCLWMRGQHRSRGWQGSWQISSGHLTDPVEIPSVFCKFAEAEKLQIILTRNFEALLPKLLVSVCLFPKNSSGRTFILELCPILEDLETSVQEKSCFYLLSCNQEKSA